MINSFKHASRRTLVTVTKPGAYGQPLPHSHPHLLRQHDLTPGIQPEEYEQRRRKLMSSLPENSLVVSVAAPIKLMSNSKDSAKEKWEGPKTSIEDAAAIFGASAAEPISSFARTLKSALSRTSHVYVDLPSNYNNSTRNLSTKALLRLLSSTVRPEVEDIIGSISSFKRRPLAPEVAPLRAIKSQAEQRIMNEAGTISGRAHAKTMRFAKPGLSEAALAAHFEYICAIQGSQRPAYVPVVASGPNALIIHYTENNHLLQDDELVLVDAGCEYKRVVATPRTSVARTFPASGKFSTAQAELYSAVLTVQKELIKDCSESAGYTLHQLHRKSCMRLREELTKLGFNFKSSMLGGDTDLERVLYPHFLSHPIGIDLHESFNMSRSNALKSDMVITIEPGIYVPPVPQFPKQYHNMGIRIEDEVLVGETEPVVLSVAAPKEHLLPIFDDPKGTPEPRSCDPRARTRRNVVATRAAQTASTSSTTTATPVFSPAGSSEVGTPVTSDIEEANSAAEEKATERRVTRSKKRVLDSTEDAVPEGRAPKRQTITNRAYIAIEVKAQEVKVKNKGKARAITPESEPESAVEFKESSGTSGSEFVASEEDGEDHSEDEEIMLDAAVRLSLQSPATNGASTSSGRTSGPSAAAILRAAAAERRLARNSRALALAIEDVFDEENEADADENVDSSESDSRMSDSESDEEPLAKKAKKPKAAKKPTALRSKAVVATFADLRQRKRQVSEVKKELKKEEKALAHKLGRRLTYAEKATIALYRFHPELKTVWGDLEENIPIITPVRAEQPKRLKLTLLPFQQESLYWMRQQEQGEWRGGMLADEMGMGKTIQVIALLVSEQKRPNLVVAPTVAIMQWRNEIEAHSEGLKVLVWHGASRESSVAELKKYDVQESGFKRKGVMIKEKSPVHQIKWNRIILDEAHNIKERSTNTAKAAFELKSDYKWCLSGTPLQNRANHANVNHYIGSSATKVAATTCFWNNEILTPIQKGGMIGPGKIAFKKLKILLDRMMLRRTKLQKADDLGLPPRTVIVRRDYFSPEEKELYLSLFSDAKRQFSTYLDQGTVLNNYSNIFSLLTRMRQMACHPDLVLRSKTNASSFVPIESEATICRLCNDFAEDAIQSKCRHIFDRECIRQYLTSSMDDSPDCPVCHVALTIDLEAPALELDENAQNARQGMLGRLDLDTWRSSTKTEALIEELSNLRLKDATTKSIVFSQFVNFLDLIAYRLQKAGFSICRLEGTMSPQARDATIKHFMNNVDVTVFLVSLKAGGVALNLTEASRVYLMDSWWNPAVEFQAMDRIHRLGQRRPVQAIKLVVEDSIESRIVQLQEKKSAMVNATLSTDDQAMGRLTPEDSKRADVGMSTRTPRELTREEVSKWIVIDTKVYDVSRFADLHPGGPNVLLAESIAGQDATQAFFGLHRHEILLKPQYKRLHIGTIGGEEETIKPPTPGQLSQVPYAEPTWLSKGYYSPYYTDNHRKFQKATREFFETVVAPEAAKADEGGKKISQEVVDKMAEVNIIAMRLGPGKHLKGRNLMGGIVKPEEFDYFHETLSGRKYVALAISEAFAGSDVGGLQTTAVRDGDYWVVTGTKKWITNGTFADYFTTGCKTDTGFTVMLIPRGPGVSTKPIKTAYSSAAGTAFVTFDKVRVPVANTLGPVGKGMSVILSNFNHERWMVCATSIAAQRQIVEECLKWGTQRMVFGKPLTSQAVIRSKLANMISRVEGCQNWFESVTYQMNNMTYNETSDKLAGPIGLLKQFVVLSRFLVIRSLLTAQLMKYHRSSGFDAILAGAEDVLGDLGVRQALKKMPKDARL
ncbi:hypothetical protein D9756_000893 [Leucocoprinus leucothites]|uniref:Uncharacterized protein n=1 Tax=Leucocoprinus leucothites TaxID=201217 RepID=A0A8H5GGL0_9AGAR|nr:hypothetical protein D9756_000893 [Leucoagaricus leucothites]